MTDRPIEAAQTSALRTIAEWPCPQQDDMQAANMRAVAKAALASAAPAAATVPAKQPKPDTKNCTATVSCDRGHITTRSCTTGRRLIDKGESSDGERDYYECPDCGKAITIDYREN